MPSVTVFSFNVQGDIGGTGISRFHVQNVDGSDLTPSQCSTAAAGCSALFGLSFNFIPNNVTWICQPVATQLDVLTGAIKAMVNIPSVPPVTTGQAAGQYVAGTGARVDWLTSTVRGRRLMRSCTFVVPLSNNAFGGNGGLTPACQTAIQSHAATLLSDLQTASMELVAYHRPPKGTQTGGAVGIVTGSRVPAQPASLRSRRS